MKKRNSKVLVKLSLGFGILIALLLSLIGAMFASFTQMGEAHNWRRHTYDVLVQTSGMAEILFSMDNAASGYALTNNPRFLVALQEGVTNFPRRCREAQRLTVDNPQQLQRLQSLEQTYLQWLTAYAQPLLSRPRNQNNAGGQKPKTGTMAQGKTYSDRMHALLDEINETESRLLQQRTQQASRAQEVTKALLVCGSALIVLLAVGLSALVVRDTQILARTNQTLKQEIAERQRAEIASLQAQREAEEARAVAERLKDESEQANSAKSEFLSRMSHELRTPLNAILGFGQLLEREDLDPRQKKAVEHIVKGGRHLLDLINEVLDIARIEAGRMQLSPEPVAIRDIVRESLDLIRPLAMPRNIRIEENAICAQVENRFVQADRQRIKQVLLNLLGNAIKYNRDGGSIRVECEPVANDRLRITICDSGPGISADKMDRLFVPFDRLGAEQSRIEGSGLGLTLSRRLIEAMGGTMGVESTVGVGSSFWVELDIVDSPSLEQLTATPPLEMSAFPELSDSDEQCLLYVEDNLSNFKLVEMILQQRPGIKLLSAMQGSVGLELAREYRPALILLDLHLPDISGHSVLLRLRAEPATQDIPVIILSADATTGQMARLLSAGADGYLTKPLDVEKFLEVVDKTLRKTDMYQEVL